MSIRDRCTPEAIARAEGLVTYLKTRVNRHTTIYKDECGEPFDEEKALKNFESLARSGILNDIAKRMYKDK